MVGVTSQERAYLAPFFAFLALLLLGEVVKSVGDGYAHWALASPQYWVFPLQILVCGGLLIHYREHYSELKNWSGMLWANAIGIIALVIWIAPQLLSFASPRTDGFHPHFFGNGGGAYWTNLGARFFRMVVIVPLAEELFWRGFLLRYCIRDSFRDVPFGTFTWKSFWIVTIAFCFEHNPPDWPAALITSALYNFLAYRTRSLPACIVAHGVTNLLLGFYILNTRQWGFW